MFEKRKRAYIAALTRLLSRMPERADSLIASFVQYARARGESQLIRPVLSATREKLAGSQADRNRIVFATEADAARAEEYLAQHGLSKADVVTEIDPDIIGGYRIETANQLVDASYKQALVALYQKLMHA